MHGSSPRPPWEGGPGSAMRVGSERGKAPGSIPAAPRSRGHCARAEGRTEGSAPTSPAAARRPRGTDRRGEPAAARAAPHPAGDDRRRTPRPGGRAHRRRRRRRRRRRARGRHGAVRVGAVGTVDTDSTVGTYGTVGADGIQVRDGDGASGDMRRGTVGSGGMCVEEGEQQGGQPQQPQRTRRTAGPLRAGCSSGRDHARTLSGGRNPPCGSPVDARRTAAVGLTGRPARTPTARLPRNRMRPALRRPPSRLPWLHPHRKGASTGTLRRLDVRLG